MKALQQQGTAAEDSKPCRLNPGQISENCNIDVDCSPVPYDQNPIHLSVDGCPGQMSEICSTGVDSPASFMPYDQIHGQMSGEDGSIGNMMAAPAVMILGMDRLEGTLSDLGLTPVMLGA